MINNGFGYTMMNDGFGFATTKGGFWVLYKKNDGFGYVMINDQTCFTDISVEKSLTANIRIKWTAGGQKMRLKVGGPLTKSSNNNLTKSFNKIDIFISL